MGINDPFLQWTKMRRYKNLGKSIPTSGCTVISSELRKGFWDPL